MSEVKQPVEHMSTGRPEAGAYYAELYNTAQFELSALREELAEIKESLAYRGSLLNRTQMRAEAAEQRNAELLVMLRQAWVDTEVSAEDCRKIDAALGQRK